MEQSLKKISNSLIGAIKQYHTTIATVLIAILIALSVFRLYQIVLVSSEKGVDGYAPTPKANDSFDQKTIDRITNLKTSADDNMPLQFPHRPSPFVE